ncbi:trypsin-like peptidase domain-containing protein [Lacinutrix neustonica]|uniref:Trypsin-like peptidase domain-containing protein n=1 Tax=Lacinutrix neustonica TaxID=2980107 RepID=A0A9E8MWA2_9FLAO|nr:trypsin-like peptidase domain-containing protein [Lacinutrix neustonica]WAC02109.1 trypsin-like peptidase domain-containing protein [Lacinutrix neustonica]
MKKVLFLLSIMIMMNSCASILNGKIQKNVSVNTKDSKSVVYVDGEKQGKGKLVKSKLARDKKVKQLKIETEGYKDQYVVHYQNQKSPLYIMSWVPFGVLLYPPFYDFGPKSYNYKKEVSVKEKLIPIAIKQEDEKYLFVKNTEFDIKQEDLKIRKIKHRSLKKNKKNKFKDIDSNLDKIEFDNSIFTESLNSILLKYKYSDSTNTIFKNKTNSAYLSAKITKLDLQYVYQRAAKRNMSFMQAEVNIAWDFQDVYGQTVFSKNYKAMSGEFSIDYNQDATTLLAVEDAIASSFLNFINNKTVKEHLAKDNIAIQKTLPTITLSNSNVVNDVDSALDGTVTIKVNEGHGSGFKISKDGYILTNFHVVANSKDDIMVVTKDSKEYKATLIRQSENLDLALLKVDASFNNHFSLPASKNYKTGQDIFIIGTPKTIELGQTLTKGIIYGDRENEGVKLIQTDASINSGNSGGPMINKSGILVGVINAKLSGLGIEGIGFAIPAELIRDALFLN